LYILPAGQAEAGHLPWGWAKAPAAKAATNKTTLSHMTNFFI